MKELVHERSNISIQSVFMRQLASSKQSQFENKVTII